MCIIDSLWNSLHNNTALFMCEDERGFVCFHHIIAVNTNYVYMYVYRNIYPPELSLNMINF